jgi:hypothetical protein
MHPIENQFQEGIQQKEMMKKKLEPIIDYKYPNIDSGATPIGSSGRAPDEDGNIGFIIGVSWYFTDSSHAGWLNEGARRSTTTGPARDGQ